MFQTFQPKRQKVLKADEELKEHEKVFPEEENIVEALLSLDTNPQTLRVDESETFDVKERTVQKYYSTGDDEKLVPGLWRKMRIESNFELSFLEDERSPVKNFKIWKYPTQDDDSWLKSFFSLHSTEDKGYWFPYHALNQQVSQVFTNDDLNNSIIPPQQFVFQTTLIHWQQTFFSLIDQYFQHSLTTFYLLSSSDFHQKQKKSNTSFGGNSFLANVNILFTHNLENPTTCQCIVFGTTNSIIQRLVTLGAKIDMLTTTLPTQTTTNHQTSTTTSSTYANYVQQKQGKTLVLHDRISINILVHLILEHIFSFLNTKMELKTLPYLVLAEDNQDTTAPQIPPKTSFQVPIHMIPSILSYIRLTSPSSIHKENDQQSSTNTGTTRWRTEKEYRVAITGLFESKLVWSIVSAMQIHINALMNEEKVPTSQERTWKNLAKKYAFLSSDRALIATPAPSRSLQLIPPSQASNTMVAFTPRYSTQTKSTAAPLDVDLLNPMLIRMIATKKEEGLTTLSMQQEQSANLKQEIEESIPSFVIKLEPLIQGKLQIPFDILLISGKEDLPLEFDTEIITEISSAGMDSEAEVNEVVVQFKALPKIYLCPAGRSVNNENNNSTPTSQYVMEDEYGEFL